MSYVPLKAGGDDLILEMDNIYPFRTKIPNSQMSGGAVSVELLKSIVTEFNWSAYNDHERVVIGTHTKEDLTRILLVLI